MQNFIRSYVSKTCLMILGLTMLTQVAFTVEPSAKTSYLDSVSNSYLYNKVDDSDYVMNLNSPEAQGLEATIKLNSKPVISKSNAKIKLSLRDSDIRQVLRMLADKAGVNIVFDKSVEGKISLDLNDIDVNDALLTIFKTMQYTYTFEDNTLTVMTLEAYQQIGFVRHNMTTIPIKYVNAESVAKFLNDNLFSSKIFGLSNKPVVTSNPRTNQIVVFGSDADVTAIKRTLPLLDTKPFINTFPVKNVTPQEMAKLVCFTLFYNSGKKEEEQDNGGDQKRFTVGGSHVACRDVDPDGEENEATDGENTLSVFKANPLIITYDSSAGEIGTIGGTVEQVQAIREIVKRFDKKSLMAYIELSVIELNESGSKQFSNTWNLWTPFVSLGFDSANGLTTNSTTPFFLWGDKYTTVQKIVDSKGKEISDRTYYTKSNNKALVYQLKYLVENGNGRVLTNPKIIVSNGLKATIDMTSDYVKSVTSQVLEGSGGLASATQKTYDIGSDEGLKIEITPIISPDGYVVMEISPEFATIKERVMAANDQGVPELAATLLQRRDLEIKGVRIRDGETLVLAGLIKEQEQQTVKKMPVLSDLPLVGAFFRDNNNEKNRDELVIVVTPHIIKDENDIKEREYNL